jgi:C1A family cysteine protease
MHLTPEQMTQMMADHLQAQPMQALSAGVVAPPIFPPSMSLLSLLPYIPAQRDQGACGDCWAWAGTGVMEIAHNVQNGVASRLSVQLLNSCNPYVSCCAGGWLANVAQFYTNAGFAIPWNNTNGAWTSGGGDCVAACGSIATAPRFPITSAAVTTIPTWGVSQAQAIANIKTALNQNQAVWFAFFMGTEADWDNFDNFWDDQLESAQWASFTSGETMTTGGGHAVLCVGYNDDDPAGPTWIMVNSWGTTPDRPEGIFHVSENIN